MEQRYKNYSRRVFKEWKQRVKKRLPELTIAFYTAKLNGLSVPYEKEKLLGSVIKDINNPFYAVTDEKGNLIEDSIRETSSMVILEILVNDLFAYINTHCIVTTK